MIYEHEIPTKSRLYFGKSAKIKREIESIASKILKKNGYEEIVTPIFSYHQHKNIDEKELIILSDNQNNILSLRADSTIDVARIITKRLGRSTTHKKWFYIQPIFKYPSSEYYQIGAEIMDNSNLYEAINSATEILNELNLSPCLQISNMNIPKIIADELEISVDVFKNANIENILKTNILWLKKLVYLQKIAQIDDIIDEVPINIKKELIKIKELCLNIKYDNIVISPLYYAKMRYYDNLFFRFIEKNSTLGMGGNYKSLDFNSVGFGLYTDELIEELM